MDEVSVPRMVYNLKLYKYEELEESVGVNSVSGKFNHVRRQGAGSGPKF